MLNTYICIFLYCATPTTLVKDCQSVTGPYTKEMTDRAIDVVVANGYAESYCGPRDEVEKSPLFKRVNNAK